MVDVDENGDPHVPVSYTHLDVYKRQHLFYAGHVVADLFCVLGTVYEAAAAQDAFIRDDICLLYTSADYIVENSLAAKVAVIYDSSDPYSSGIQMCIRDSR